MSEESHTDAPDAPPAAPWESTGPPAPGTELHTPALAGPYRPQVNTGNGTSGGGFEREYEPVESDQVDEVVEDFEVTSGYPDAELGDIFTGEIVYTPPEEPAPGHLLVKTTMTFITTTPIALENAARLAIQEADIEQIWLGTDFEDLIL